MNTYEKCKKLRGIILNRAAEVIAYQSWDNDFASEQIRQIPEKLKKNKENEDFFQINPADMTKEQMQDLGYCSWRDDNPMMLIPLWLFPFLMDEFESECIDGEKKLTKKSDMDNDNRFGCLAYGVTPLH